MSRSIISQPCPHLLLRGARVVDPGAGIDQTLDVLIEDGVIKQVAPQIPAPDNFEMINAAGLVLTPGWFDLHVHFREPGREDEETVLTGCAAALAGGFTGVCPMPNTSPATDKAEIVKSIIAQSRQTMVDVHPIAAATKGREGKEPTEIAELVDAGAVAFSDDGCSVRTAELVRRVMEYAGMYQKPLIEHAEDESLCLKGAMNEGVIATKLGLSGLPTIAEDIIVARDVLIAEYTGGRLHIAHISSKGAIELVRRAKAAGVQVTCEVTPHHFSLSHEAVIGFETNTKMNPPLRSPADVEAVIAGLQDGTIDAIATDHAPHSSEEKNVEYPAAPFGVIGLETAMGLIISRLVLTKKLSLSQAVAKVTVAPRRILNLPPAEIKAGQTANLTVFSIEKKWVVDKTKFYSKSRNTPFDGWQLAGKVFGVYHKGQWWASPDF